MVHSVAASEHQRCAISPGRGAHTLLGEHFEGTGPISASKTASEGALGLVHRGAVQGAGRLWAAEGRWGGCSTIW